ncbi:uncharacterized protein LOC123273376 [Cotesia glomerata]|uniref:uncharacterized protein LOC123273376 n=1 Tax=Cotesia glomerata TaxID=32391 RepID=UPI001D025941|nr:uncharacterized protein LOC123273376 [Cotesia glomerata]
MRKCILPINGTYRWSANQSHKAIKWLILKEREYGWKTIHAGYGKEFRLPSGIPVDGYFKNLRTGQENVLQFHGCYRHGCPKCYRINRDKKLNASDNFESMHTRYDSTIATSEKIRGLGYNLIEEWECDFDVFLASVPETAMELREHPLLSIEPLKPRDAFFGGRTESFVSLYDVKDNEKVKYVDVCSLYPYICKTEGLIKCTVLPPRKLYHPVLPCKIHNRLLFALRRTFAQELRQTGCNHKTKDRKFTGTWVVDEVKKAVSKGYIVLKIYEIWQYDIMQYNKDKECDELFTEDINNFLKIKTEASGFPKDCVTEEDKNKYIEDYERAGGICLDKDRIKYNSGLRSVAKLSLNSLWGKFGQRENLMQTEIVTTRNRLMELLTDTQIEICGFLTVNDKTLYINFINAREAIKPSRTTNVVIAAYTTVQARLKLYSYLENLGKRVLYCDTDSCIYVSADGQYEPPTGKFLGDLTDELEKEGVGSYITSFVTGGPKFYAFIIRRPDDSTAEVCKVKATLHLRLPYVNINAVQIPQRRLFRLLGCVDVPEICYLEVFPLRDTSNND